MLDDCCHLYCECRTALRAQYNSVTRSRQLVWAWSWMVPMAPGCPPLSAPVAPAAAAAAARRRRGGSTPCCWRCAAGSWRWCGQWRRAAPASGSCRWALLILHTFGGWRIHRDMLSMSQHSQAHDSPPGPSALWLPALTKSHCLRASPCTWTAPYDWDCSSLVLFRNPHCLSSSLLVPLRSPRLGSPRHAPALPPWAGAASSSWALTRATPC